MNTAPRVMSIGCRNVQRCKFPIVLLRIKVFPRIGFSYSGLYLHSHHLLVQGGWNKQREDTGYSTGTESAHHPGTAADVTENPPPSVQNPSEILKLLHLALAD